MWPAAPAVIPFVIMVVVKTVAEVGDRPVHEQRKQNLQSKLRIFSNDTGCPA